MSVITKGAVDLVEGQILDNSFGFNYWVGQLAGGSDYPDVTPFSMTPNANLLRQQIDRSVIINTATDFQYPLMLIYAKSMDQTHRYTPTQFSGTIILTVEFWMSFESAEMPINMEQYLDLAEDAMFESFNSFNNHNIWENNPYVYNNTLGVERSGMVSGGQNWWQRSIFRFTIEAPAIQSRTGL